MAYAACLLNYPLFTLSYHSSWQHPCFQPFFFLGPCPRLITARGHSRHSFSLFSWYSSNRNLLKHRKYSAIHKHTHTDTRTHRAMGTQLRFNFPSRSKVSKKPKRKRKWDTTLPLFLSCCERHFVTYLFHCHYIFVHFGHLFCTTLYRLRAGSSSLPLSLSILPSNCRIPNFFLSSPWLAATPSTFSLLFFILKFFSFWPTYDA